MHNFFVWALCHCWGFKIIRGGNQADVVTNVLVVKPSLEKATLKATIVAEVFMEFVL